MQRTRVRHPLGRYCLPEGRTLGGVISAVARFSHKALPDSSSAALQLARASDRDVAATGGSCTCGPNCHHQSCRCVPSAGDGGGGGGAVATVPFLQGHCDVCTNSMYNYLGGCFQNCAAAPWLRESGLAVIGRTCVAASAPISAGYTVVHRGAKSGEVGLMFSTALDKKFETFYLFSTAGSIGCKWAGKDCSENHGGVVTLETCKSRCDDVASCRGFVYFRTTHRCRGLSDLGSAPASTRKDVDSYRKL
jgi:hypothetical protein